MKSGICVKCRQAMVHLVDTSRFADSGIPLTGWKSAGLAHYICVSCGYAESYVVDFAALEQIAKEKPRVIPAEELKGRLP